MRVIKTKNYEEMSKVAADMVAAQMILKPDSILGLATGSTPIGLYKNLIRLYKQGDISFKDIKTINLDEYIGIEPTHDQSYRYFMNTNLFDHVDIDKSKTNVPNGLAEDMDKECDRYENIIKEFGGIDVQILGIGNNGHIGFNEPGDTFIKKTHRISLAQNTIEANARFFDTIDDVPKEAVSMGIKTIMDARGIILVASGKSKAQAIYDTVCAEINPHVPASILQLHKNVVVIVDEEAGSLI